jgi:hypothetical protein
MDNQYQAQAEKKMAALESWMAPIFAKAPHLPQNIREGITNIAPWLALIFGILGLLAISSLGGFGLLLSLSFLGGSYSFMLFVAILFGLIASVLDLLAYKPLTKRMKKGWNYLFYGNVLSAAGAILQIISGYSVIGNIIGAVIGFWLLFEVREMYKA